MSKHEIGAFNCGCGWHPSCVMNSEAMTDEELLDAITEMVGPPNNTPERDGIWRFIMGHRQVGWRRRFTARGDSRHG